MGGRGGRRAYCYLFLSYHLEKIVNTPAAYTRYESRVFER